MEDIQDLGDSLDECVEDDAFEDVMDSLIFDMNTIAVIKERNSVEELDTLYKYFNILDDIVSTKDYDDSSIVTLRKELLDIFDGYKKIFYIITSNPKTDSYVKKFYDTLATMNQELLYHGPNMSNFDFLTRSFILMQKLLRHCEDPDNVDDSDL